MPTQRMNVSSKTSNGAFMGIWALHMMFSLFWLQPGYDLLYTTHTRL